MRTRSTIQDLIRQFKSQTGLDEETARRYLESQQWNLKSAIYSYYQEQMVQEPNSSDDVDAISRNTRITIPPRARLESLESLYGSSRGVLSSMMLQARLENKWVLINLQDLSLQSHNFDNDVWSVIKVSDISNFNFIFRKLLQNSSHEFHDIVVNYKVDKFPAILLIDSVTGELLDNLRHLKSAQSVLEDLLLFLDEHNFEEGYPRNDQVGETFSSINSIESNVSTDPEKFNAEGTIIAASKRFFHPNEKEFEMGSYPQAEDRDKKFKTSSSESANSSLFKGIKEMTIEETNIEITPFNLAFKLPDGSRKVYNLTSESTVNDLKRLIEGLNLKDAQLKLTPNGPSVLKYPSSTKLSNVGLCNNTVLYVDES